MITLEKLDNPLENVQKRYLTDAWREAQKTYTIYSPASGEKVAEVADCGEAEAVRAAEIATEAFESWRDTTAFERSTLLLRWRDLIMAHQEELARTMTLEMGKPITEARGEVAYAAGFITWYAEEAKRVYGDTLPSHAANKRLFAIKQPVGPTFAVTPWNFPAGMVTRKAAPALAAGCTFILKPAEQTPLSALHLAALWERGGRPGGDAASPADLRPRPGGEHAH